MSFACVMFQCRGRHESRPGGQLTRMLEQRSAAAHLASSGPPGRPCCSTTSSGSWRTSSASCAAHSPHMMRRAWGGQGCTSTAAQGMGDGASLLPVSCEHPGLSTTDEQSLPTTHVTCLIMCGKVSHRQHLNATEMRCGMPTFQVLLF